MVLSNCMSGMGIDSCVYDTGTTRRRDDEGAVEDRRTDYRKECVGTAAATVARRHPSGPPGRGAGARGQAAGEGRGRQVESPAGGLGTVLWASAGLGTHGPDRHDGSGGGKGQPSTCREVSETEPIYL